MWVSANHSHANKKSTIQQKPIQIQVWKLPITIYAKQMGDFLCLFLKLCLQLLRKLANNKNTCSVCKRETSVIRWSAYPRMLLLSLFPSWLSAASFFSKVAALNFLSILCCCFQSRHPWSASQPRLGFGEACVSECVLGFPVASPFYFTLYCTFSASVIVTSNLGSTFSIMHVLHCLICLCWYKSRSKHAKPKMVGFIKVKI